MGQSPSSLCVSPHVTLCVGWTATSLIEKGSKQHPGHAFEEEEHEGSHPSPKNKSSFYISPLSAMLETDEMSEEPSSAGGESTRDAEIEECIEDDPAIIIPSLELSETLVELSLLQSPNPQIRPLSARLSPFDVPALLLPLPSPLALPISKSQLYLEPDTPFDTTSSIGESISSIIPLCSPLSEMTLDSTHQHHQLQQHLQNHEDDDGRGDGDTVTEGAVRARPVSPKLPPTHLSRRFRKTVSNALAVNFPRLYKRKSERGVSERVVVLLAPPVLAVQDAPVGLAE